MQKHCALSLKLDPYLPKNFVICFIESPLKMIKNAFYFILKAPFVFNILKFLSYLNFWSCRKNGLIEKIFLTSKFMTSQPGYQTITIQISREVKATRHL